jgi:predicted N-acyltransferase
VNEKIARMMTPDSRAAMDLKVFSSMDDIEAGVWDELGAGRAFQSYRWYAYAEKVLAANCRPFYILIFENRILVGRAAFYLSPSEPLPIQSRFLRGVAEGIFQRWPLFICRSPFSGLSGLVLSDTANPELLLAEICAACLKQARAWKASFAFYDFVEQAHIGQWPPLFRPMMLNDPGMALQISWPDFENFLASLGKDERYHYRRAQRKAQEAGIVVERHANVPDIDEALALIRNVERRFASTPSPWTRAMLENLALADATWLTASLGGRLVGCGLTLRDSDSQLHTALGLANDTPYVYFSLLYESLKIAFERGARQVRLGSGAYDVKRRLGAQVEKNNNVLVTSPYLLLQKIIKRMAK